MPGRQVRLDQEIVTIVHRRRRELGFSATAPDGAVISELAREGMEARLEAKRKRERAALYADWAGERDLVEDTGVARRAAMRDGVA